MKASPGPAKSARVIIDRPAGESQIRSSATALAGRPALLSANLDAVEDQAHHGREDDCGCPGHVRFMPPSPPRYPSQQGVAVGPHRFVGQPPLQVIGQRPSRLVSVFRSDRHRLQANGLECRRNRGIHLSGSLEGARANLGQDAACHPLGRVACRSRRSRASRPGYRCRLPGQAGRPGPRPVRDSYRLASR